MFVSVRLSEGRRMSRHNKKAESQRDNAEKRERGFQLTGLQSFQLKEYNALHDPNMRHFFESKNNQYLLYRTGQIDSNGRVIELDKNKSKLFILEREFKEAERIEERRQKEEMEMRYRVQRKRFNELEKMRKLEILEKLKAAPEIEHQEILRIYLQSLVAKTLRTQLSEISTNANLIDIGMDSLMTMEVVNQLSRDLDLMIYPREFYERPKIDSLAAYLSAELRNKTITLDSK